MVKAPHLLVLGFSCAHILNILASFPGNAATFTGDVSTLIEGLGQLCLGDCLCGYFCKHIQNQFDICHIVPQVLFLEPLKVFIFPDCQPAPGLGQLISKDSDIIDISGW